MMWPQVVQADFAAMQANDRFMALILDDFTRVRAANDGDVAEAQCPLVEYTIVSQVETERFCEVLIQWDVLARTDTQLWGLELELHRMFHRDVAAVVGGMPMQQSAYQQRRAIIGLPDGIRGASVEYLQVPARLRYQPPAES